MGERSAGAAEDRGFILILVIWFTALIALLAIGFTSAVQSHLRLTSGALQGAKAEALADAGVELAVLSLLTGGPDRRFPINGLPVSCSVEGLGVVTLRVRDAGGRVSLNLASERMLQALFIGLGANRETASRATDLILDYRDTDSNRRPNGAELPEYVDAGRPLGPKNGPFDTTDELNQVLGLDPALIALAAPHITVHSQTAGLDPRTTSPELAAIITRGAEQLPPLAVGAGNPGGPVPAEFVNGSPQKVFWIESTAQLGNGAVFARETVAELQSGRDALPIYKMWKRGVSQPPGTNVANGTAPPC